MKLFLKCPQILYRNSLFSQNPETYSGIKHSVLKSMFLVFLCAKKCLRALPLIVGVEVMLQWIPQGAGALNVCYSPACFSLTSENLLYEQQHFHILYLILFEFTLKYTNIPKDFFFYISHAVFRK